jgi:uncharacterized protein (TIGR03000 family)
MYGAPVMSAPPSGEKLAPPKEKGKDEVSAPATIILSVPADAKLTIDGVATSSTSATRSFVTPELTGAKEYVYTFNAEITRDGQTLTATEKVTVRAGQESRVSIPTDKFAAVTVAVK